MEKEKEKKVKTYIGISRDHSGSMAGITEAARKDYNQTITDLQNAAGKDVDSIVTVVECGVRNERGDGVVRRVVTNSNVHTLKPLTNYIAEGGSTPLIDSVGELIGALRSVPDANAPDVSFLIFVITDGQENSSRHWTRHSIGNEIRQLQATDRWTFVFQVPRGGAREIQTHFGVPAGNIREWEQTERGFQEVGAARTRGIQTYYSNSRAGVKSTNTFFTDLSGVKAKDLKQKMTNIASKVKIMRVNKVLDHARGASIQSFVEKETMQPYAPGTAFYELIKKEAKILPNRQILIHDRKSKAVYAGAQARQLLGIPDNQEIKLEPGNHDAYDVFIESHSVNRVLPLGSRVIYWAQNRF